MFGLGTGELIVIGATIFLLFGAKRLPELGGSLARGIKNFQEGMKGNREESKKVDQKDQ